MKRSFSSRSRRSGAGQDVVGCKLQVVEDGALRDAWVLSFDPKLGHLVHYSEHETWWEDLQELEVSNICIYCIVVCCLLGEK